MRKGKLLNSGSLLALVLFLVGSLGSTHGAQETKDLKVGKRGTIKLTAPTTVKGVELEQAEYKVYCEHLDSGVHRLVFVRLKELAPFFSEGHSKVATSDIVKVPCEMERLSGKAKQTKLRLAKKSGRYELVHVEIRGENVRHVF